MMGRPPVPAADKLRPHPVCMADWQAAFYRKVGGGNLSAGDRKCAAAIKALVENPAITLGDVTALVDGLMPSPLDEKTS